MFFKKKTYLVKQAAEFQKQLEEMKTLMQQQEQTAAAAALTAATTVAAAVAVATIAAAAQTEKAPLQLRIDDLERAQTSATGLPSPQNLSSNMTSTPLDATTVKRWILNSETRTLNHLDTRINDLETKISGWMNHTNIGTHIFAGGATSAPRVGPFSPFQSTDRECIAGLPSDRDKKNNKNTIIMKILCAFKPSLRPIDASPH